MKNSLLMKFIKDRFIYIAGYVLGHGLLILYAYLTAQLSNLIYPIGLSLFILFYVILHDGMRYYKFYRDLRKGREDDYYRLEAVLEEHGEVDEALAALQEKYMKEISKISMEASNRQHFLSQWIHNMKTPVAVINLILQKSRMEELLGEELLRDIEEENERLHNGLEQVLNIIRMEEFFRDYEPEVVDIVQSLREVINSKKSQFIYSNVYPRLEVEGEAYLIITDSKWNKFMLEQIISNAIKYSTTVEGKKYVTFNIVKTERATTLEIHDEGVGIPEQDVKKVFEPFFTGENGRRFKNSTGIGLYISSKIAEKLGHEIKISSEVNKGTTISITYISRKH